MRVCDLVEILESLAPLTYAEPWDNVGLLLGSGSNEVRTILLTIDFTGDVLDEAIKREAQLIVTYHPVLFEPVRRITDDDPAGRMLLSAIAHDLAVYSPHTALDAVAGGVTDWLADSLGSGYRRPITPHCSHEQFQEVKIVTFAPSDAVDRLREALASAGAGRIGKYELCSFATEGTGTFLGGEASHPSVGESGRLERVEECRLEMVCPTSSLPLIVSTLRQFHPYEEPAFDLYPLSPVPHHQIGLGRKVVLDQPATVSTLADRIKAYLGIQRIKMSGADGEIRNIGLVPGAGGSLLDEALAQDCELFITGEMSHHRVLYAHARNCSVILTGHANSERGYLPVLEKNIEGSLADKSVRVLISARDRTAMRVV